MDQIIRVGPSKSVLRAPHIDEKGDWQGVGRKHFLNRAAFDEQRRAQGLSWERRDMIELIILPVALVLAVFYAVREVTRYFCPLTIEIFDRVMRFVYRRLSIAIHGVWRTVILLLWKYPSQEIGAAVTAWLYLVILTGLLTILVILSLAITMVPWLVVLYLLIGGLWWIARRRAQSRYRVRVLPTRRIGR